MHNRKIPFHILISVICLLLAVGGTYAWFTKRFYLQADNEQIQLEHGGVTIAEYHVYKYVQESGTVIDLTETEDTGKVVKLDGYELTPYDSIFTERNVNSPLVFEMDLIVDDIENLYLGCTCSSEDPLPTEDDENRYTSNIMRIGAATETCIGVSAASSKTEKFEAVSAYFNEDTGTGRSNAKNFLPNCRELKDSEGRITGYELGTKLTEISCPVSIGSAEVLPEDKCVTVYYVIDYAELLVRAQQVNQFSKIGILQQYVPFMDDITFTGFMIEEE